MQMHILLMYIEIRAHESFISSNIIAERFFKVTLEIPSKAAALSARNILSKREKIEKNIHMVRFIVFSCASLQVLHSTLQLQCSIGMNVQTRMLCCFDLINVIEAINCYII